MRLAIFGTGSFGVPSLEALYGTSHTVTALITQVPTDAHSRRPAQVPEIVRLAERQGTPIFRFADVKSPEALACFKTLDADLFFVCDYGQILSPEGIATAKFGGINLHGSLLPKYRGAAPVQWAILNGDTETGVTVIHITPTVDAGPMLAAEKTPIFPDETHPELESRLAKLGVKHVLAAVEHFASGGVSSEKTGILQDPALACKAPKIKKSQAEIHWESSAAEIRNKIRAFDAWPRAFTSWTREGKPPLRLILQAVPEILDTADDALPGTVLEVGETLIIKTGTGALAFRGVQPSGKKMMSIPEFARGYGLKPGERFTAE